MQNLIKLYKDKSISHGTAYEVREFARKFANLRPIEQNNIPELKNMLQLEVIRILGRKKLESDGKEDKILTQLITNLEQMFNSGSQPSNTLIDYVATVNDFAQEMIVALEISHSIKHAEGEE